MPSRAVSKPFLSDSVVGESQDRSGITLVYYFLGGFQTLASIFNTDTPTEVNPCAKNISRAREKYAVVQSTRVTKLYRSVGPPTAKKRDGEQTQDVGQVASPSRSLSATAGERREPSRSIGNLRMYNPGT